MKELGISRVLLGGWRRFRVQAQAWQTGRALGDTTPLHKM